MNLDLAIMALDGLTRTPIDIRVDEKGIAIGGPASGLKELARLLLLIASDSGGGEQVELQPGVHTTRGSLPLALRVS
jgi:hypothetical protein